ncbi:hypothetical protein ScPMuIL_011231 [Solemya velum]
MSAANQDTGRETQIKIENGISQNRKRDEYLEWPDYFMAIAFLSAQRSKDPRTQVGACIVNDENKIVGIGYNGMPIGCNDDVMPWGRNTDSYQSKQLYVCHAELNAVLNKNSSDVKNCTIYVALFPCNECAKVIIQSGIKYVVYYSDKYHDKVEFAASRRMFDLANIQYRTSSWATEAEILAASRVYNIDIFIDNCSTVDHQWIKFPIAEHCDHNINKDFICLTLKNEHFDLLQMNQRPCMCQVKSVAYQQHISTVHDKLNSNTSIPQVEGDRDGEQLVINLSSKQLSSSQISLLSKRLQFVPTRRNYDKGKLIANLKEWERRMRLREYYFEQEDGDQDKQYDKYKKRSQWVPNSGRDKWLDEYIKCVKDDVIKGLTRRFKMNLTQEEESAMRELLDDQDIVIRPADKGSGVVVLDTKVYVNKIEEDMNQNDTYVELGADKTSQIERKMKKLVNNMYKNGSITKDMKSYLIPSGGLSGKLQGNPKLHKMGVPLRTIVNGRGHPTEKLAELVEEQLREHVTSLPSYIKDTTDFLNKMQQIPQPLPKDAILFCFDVKALYPSVPRDEARMAAVESLGSRVVEGRLMVSGRRRSSTGNHHEG